MANANSANEPTSLQSKSRPVQKEKRKDKLFRFLFIKTTYSESFW